MGNFWKDNYIEYEISGDKSNISVKEYLNKIKPYSRDIITDLQKSVTWNIELTVVINFIFSKDTDKEQVMHSNTNHVDIITYDNANKVIENVFESLPSRYLVGLETSMRVINFLFGLVQLLY